MLDQHWVGRLVGRTLSPTTLNNARAAGARWLVPACALTVVAGLYALDRGAAQPLQPVAQSSVPHESSPSTAAQAAAPSLRSQPVVESAAAPQQSAPRLLPAVPHPQAASKPADVEPKSRLTREQHNIVQFIAKTYSVASDAAEHFVFEAFSAGRAARIDPHLVLAVMSVESSFNPRAQSHQGAKGLMQVLARVHQDKFEPFGGAKAVFDPMANIRVGTEILKDYLARAGSVPGALKWYVGAALMPDDGGYGAKVLFQRERIAAAAAGRTIPSEPPRVAAATPRPASVKVRWTESRQDSAAREEPAVTNVRSDAPASDGPARVQPLEAPTTLSAAAVEPGHEGI